MGKDTVGIYDSSTCICLSKQSAAAWREHGENSPEYEAAQQEFREWWNGIEPGGFTFPPNANFVTYNGIDLRLEKLNLDD